MLLLPVLMWIAGALVTWLLVSRLLIRPLKRLERAVRNYRPGSDGLDLPRKLGRRRKSSSFATPSLGPSTRVDEVGTAR